MAGESWGHIQKVQNDEQNIPQLVTGCWADQAPSVPDINPLVARLWASGGPRVGAGAEGTEGTVLTGIDKAFQHLTKQCGCRSILATWQPWSGRLREDRPVVSWGVGDGLFGHAASLAGTCTDSFSYFPPKGPGNGIEEI